MKHRTYDADFDESFDFDVRVPQPGEATAPLKIDVLDHDTV